MDRDIKPENRSTVREACRRGMALDGADAKALEHALTITEGERDALRKAAASCAARSMDLNVVREARDRVQEELDGDRIDDRTRSVLSAARGCLNAVLRNAPDRCSPQAADTKGE